MLRFLARGGAGTDVSCTGRARRGLILSRRNQRRTEEGRDDKGRDRKFGSHQNVSVGLQQLSKTRPAIWFRCVTKHCANFIFQRTRSWPPSNIRHLTNIGHVPNTGFAQSPSIGSLASTRHKRRANLIGGCAMLVASINGPRCSKCGETMSLRIIEPERPGFESQTFECPKCYDTKTLVAPIASAADVSGAAPTSTAIPSPRSSRPFRTSRDLCSRYRV
jgi:hypothetical protein